MVVVGEGVGGPRGGCWWSGGRGYGGRDGGCWWSWWRALEVVRERVKVVGVSGGEGFKVMGGGL